MPSTRRGSHRAAADAVIVRALAVFVVAMAAQSLGPVLDQLPLLAGWWNVLFASTVLLAMLAVAVAGALGRTFRTALTLFAGSAACGLALWPLAYEGTATQPPWLWNVLGVAVAAVAVAWGRLPALVYAAAVVLLVAIIRVRPDGGGVDHATAHQDATYLAIAGIALTAAVEAIRVGAARADASAAAAEDAHRAEAAARAELVERNRLGAVLHDSVLAALVTAAHAASPPERRAAATLAADSLRRLDDITRPDVSPRMSLADLTERLRSTAVVAGALPVTIRALLPPPFEGWLTTEAGEAVLSATYAALDNASRHSGADRVAITIGQDEIDRRLRVEVRDDGRGFDPERVSSRCLGIRLSIVQRMIDAGGTAVVWTRPGLGTSVVLGCEVQP